MSRETERHAMADRPETDEVELYIPTESTTTERWADAGQIMAVFCGDPRVVGTALERPHCAAGPARCA